MQGGGTLQFAAVPLNLLGALDGACECSAGSLGGLGRMLGRMLTRAQIWGTGPLS